MERAASNFRDGEITGFENLPAIHAAVVPAGSGHAVLVAGVNANLSVQAEDGSKEPARRPCQGHHAQQDIPTGLVTCSISARASSARSKT